MISGAINSPLLLVLLCIFSATAVAGQPTEDSLVMNLSETVQTALEVSPEVDQVQAQRSYDQARLSEARASRFLTEFTLTTGHSVAPGLSVPANNPYPENALYLNPNVENDWSPDALRPYNEGEIVALQPLWTWGQLSNTIEAASYGVEVASAEVREKALEVTLRTATLYYDLLLAEQLERVAEEAGGVVDRAMEEVQRLLDEGAEGVDVADLYQTRITRQEYLRRVTEVEQRLATARAAIQRQLFLPEDATFRPASSILEPLAFDLQPLETYEEIALAYRPEIDRAAYGLKARSAQVDVAQSDYFPKLFLRASARFAYARGRPDFDSPFVDDPISGGGTEIGVGLRQNLNFFQTRARVAQAKAERNEVRHLKEAARQLVLFEVEQAYSEVNIAAAAVEAQEQSLQLSREWLRTEQINFDLGLGETENLVNAVRANLTLQVSYYQAVRDYNVAILELLDAAGILATRIESGTLVE